MTRLVDDLLEVSRITLGRLQLQRKTEDLGSILTAVIEDTRSSTSPAQDFTVELPEEALPVHGDSVRLSQAISNVIENAIKYTPPNGQIQLRARRESEHCVVRIRDTGIGISPQAVSQIFEMFSQEERPDKAGNSGLGIGLALTRSIIELHGGTIEASSPGFGQGSEFVIRLPLDASHAEESATRDEAPSDAGSQGILVVDDNVDAADTLCMSLELSGHAARAVYRGAAALAALEDFTPDLVLLDIGLPDIDGYEVARRLRARLGTACPKLVALSGWGRDEDKERAAAAGIDAYLTTPVNPEVLSRLVAESIRPSSPRTGVD
jgi:CheY-like chemotaxis protein/two-component sensor histidine kinase